VPKRICALLLTVIFLVAACRPPEKSSAPKLRPFEFLIDWQAEPTYLGIYYAKELGQFEKLGLNVSIVQSWGANQAVTAVAAGRYKISTASGGATVLGYNSGAENSFPCCPLSKIPTVIYGLLSTGVARPKDLEGKRIGIYPGSITKTNSMRL